MQTECVCGGGSTIVHNPVREQTLRSLETIRGLSDEGVFRQLEYRLRRVVATLEETPTANDARQALLELDEINPENIRYAERIIQKIKDIVNPTSR